jgi:hypothetical protein
VKILAQYTATTSEPDVNAALNLASTYNLIGDNTDAGLTGSTNQTGRRKGGHSTFR